jgi:hypothetical protein
MDGRGVEKQKKSKPRLSSSRKKCKIGWTPSLPGNGEEERTEQG